MKALTLHQPWASLIAEGPKTVETRSWSAPAWVIGQRIAIHAGKRQIRISNEYDQAMIRLKSGASWSIPGMGE